MGPDASDRIAELGTQPPLWDRSGAVTYLKVKIHRDYYRGFRTPQVRPEPHVCHPDSYGWVLDLHVYHPDLTRGF